MVKTLLYKTIKDFTPLKAQLERLVEEHNTGPQRESGNLALSHDPKLHLFTLSFKESDDRFQQALTLFDRIKHMKIHNAKVKSSDDNYGDIVMYFLPTSEQKTLIERILQIEGVKRNPMAITIGTIRENYRVSPTTRERGLTDLLRKIYVLMKGANIEFEDARGITLT